MLTRSSVSDAAVGVAIGLVYAHATNGKYAPRVIFGGMLGVLGGAWLRGERGARDGGRTLTGWVRPPHPIEVMPQFDPKAGHVAQARSVLLDYYHDDNLRNWFDKGEVKHAFGVKETPDYDPSMLVAAYENKNDPVWRKLGQHAETSWKELDKNIGLAIKKRMKLGSLPKASYDKDPIRIFYYDNDRMKMVEYSKQNLNALLNPQNHYYWRDPSVRTYETQDPAAIDRERKTPGKPGDHPGWGGEGFDWNKDVPGQFGSILQSTLQLVGFAMQLTGYAAAVGSAISQASPYIGTIAQTVDDAFQGNDNSKAVAAIGKMVLAVANKGLGEVAGVELPPVAMQALGQGVDTIGQQIAAGQKEHLDYTGIWTKILAKAKTFHKVGDAEAHALEKILGENSMGKVFIGGYQAGKLADLSTIDAISKLFTVDGNKNVWMLGAGLGQLATHQGAAQKTALPAHAAHAAHAAQGDWDPYDFSNGPWVYGPEHDGFSWER